MDDAQRERQRHLEKGGDFMPEELTDRELDAFLAEHLFGLSLTGPYIRVVDNGDGTGYPIPLYSSTGDGMILVLEAMRPRGWDWWVTARNGITASFVRAGRQEDGAWFHGDSMSLPRAVALAAKAALEA